MNAPLPPNESARLADLYRYEILDTPPEIHFDELVELASIVCGMPVTVVNFIDRDRQWSKAKFGTQMPELPRSMSVCAHTILGTDLLEIHDALEDDRTRDHPFVKGEPYFRYYAGVPLISERGFALGTLCALDTNPRTLDPRQKNILLTLARQVSELLEKRLYDQLKSAQLERTTRLAEIGEKAAELAHEINNPLGALILGLSGLRSRLEKSVNGIPSFTSESTIKLLKKLESYGQRIAKISKNIRLQSRDENTVQMEVIDLRGIISDSIEICAARIQSLNIKLVQNILEHPVLVIGHPVQLGQVIINLLNNAIDACGATDACGAATDAYEATVHKEIEIQIELAEQEIHIRCIDNGQGISPKIESLIFQPFFSTKPTGKGTGLGLSISQNIAREHGGKLILDHSFKKTCFTLSLPRLQQPTLN